HVPQLPWPINPAPRHRGHIREGKVATSKLIAVVEEAVVGARKDRGSSPETAGAAIDQESQGKGGIRSAASAGDGRTNFFRDAVSVDEDNARLRRDMPLQEVADTRVGTGRDAIG